jgi:hypothetical protein
MHAFKDRLREMVAQARVVAGDIEQHLSITSFAKYRLRYNPPQTHSRLNWIKSLTDLAPKFGPVPRKGNDLHGKRLS